jgi:predicted helicase
MGKSKSYDSYIRAIRWGSDRLGETGGIMAYLIIRDMHPPFG